MLNERIKIKANNSSGFYDLVSGGELNFLTQNPRRSAEEYKTTAIYALR